MPETEPTPPHAAIYNRLVAAAEARGDDTGSEYEVGDLQSFLLAALARLNPTQLTLFMCDRNVKDALEVAEGVAARPAYSPSPRPEGSPPVWGVPLEMIESRRYREESRCVLAVEAASAEEAKALATAATEDGGPLEDCDALEWDEVDSDAVGADVVHGPAVIVTAAVERLPDDHPVDLRAADFEAAEEPGEEDDDADHQERV